MPRRFLAVRAEVERRKEDVGDAAGRDHLARDLGVTGLVGIEERVDAEPGQGEERDEREHDGARERASRQRSASHTWRLTACAVDGWTLRGAR